MADWPEEIIIAIDTLNEVLPRRVEESDDCALCSVKTTLLSEVIGIPKRATAKLAAEN